MAREKERLIVLAAAVYAYFVLFPEDFPAVIAPAREILSLTDAVSSWLYVALAGCVIGWAIVRCFGRRIDVSGKN
jgi:hypothetical protein